MYSRRLHSMLKNKLAIVGVVASIILVTAYALMSWKTQPAPNDIVEDVITLSNQNRLQAIRSKNPQKGLLLLIADKNTTETNMAYAKQFAALSYYVAIIDNQQLLNSRANNSTTCLNLATTLAELSAQLNAQFKLSNQTLPILVGVEDGAASLYVALAQAQKKMFHAAVSINFSPQIAAHAPLCEEEKFISAESGSAFTLKSVNHLPTSFYIFQDKNSSSDLASATFTDNISNAKLTVAQDKNQTITEAIQILQWLDPRLADQISSDVSDSDLPLIEVNVAQNQAQNTQITTQTMAILLTGDGGWAEIDKQLAKILAAQGIPTVGFDSLSYFWKARTPATTSQDIEKVIAQYLEKWKKQRVILIGYSFGADVLPFVANNLSAETQQKISLIALVGMGKTAAFEFRLSSWMNADKSSDRLPLLPEIEKMKWANSVCIYGTADPTANCLPTEIYGVKAISMSGDHHFDKNYDALAKHIIDNQKYL